MAPKHPTPGNSVPKRSNDKDRALGNGRQQGHLSQLQTKYVHHPEGLLATGPSDSSLQHQLRHARTGPGLPWARRLSRLSGSRLPFRRWSTHGRHIPSPLLPSTTSRVYPYRTHPSPTPPKGIYPRRSLLRPLDPKWGRISNLPRPCAPDDKRPPQTSINIKRAEQFGSKPLPGLRTL